MRRLLAACTILLAPVVAFGQARIPYDCWRDQQSNNINTCKYCHQSGQPGASNQDINRQGAHPVQENEFLNVIDLARLDDLVPPETIPLDLTAFLALDNYRAAMEGRDDAAGISTGAGEYKYFPDLDPEQTGPDGFANNGWRAFKWKLHELAWPAFIGRIQLSWNIKSVAEEFNQTFFGFVSAKEQELSLTFREEARARSYHSRAQTSPV